MPSRILVSNLMMLKERDRFDASLRRDGLEPVWADVDQYLSETACLALAGQFDGWLAGDDQITARVLDAFLPRLKVISKWGSGVDSIDLAAARARNVPVMNAPGAFADAVAEVAIGYLLMTSRHLAMVDRAVRNGAWPKPAGRSPRGRVAGIIGYGAIGRRIGELARALGMELRICDPAVQDEATLSALELARQSDVVFLACNLTPQNIGLVDAAFLAAMGRDGLLINVARGPLVSEQALVHALANDLIAGAALDVFDVEPLTSASPLRDFPNLVLGSHNANNEVTAVERVHAITIKNLKAHLMPDPTLATAE